MTNLNISHTYDHKGNRTDHVFTSDKLDFHIPVPHVSKIIGLPSTVRVQSTVDLRLIKLPDPIKVEHLKIINSEGINKEQFTFIGKNLLRMSNASEFTREDIAREEGKCH